MEFLNNDHSCFRISTGLTRELLNPWYNIKGDSAAFESLGHTTLIITEIQTGEIKPGSENPMDTRKSLHAQAKDYDPGFWRNYDYDYLVPLTRKQIRDLEWEIPLEKQFQAESVKKMQKFP